MRSRFAPVLLAATALLLTPGAASAPDVPGDPTPPVVTPVINGTLGLNGWYVTNVTVSWSITDPESIILDTTGCDTKTLTADTMGTSVTCSATSDGGTTTVTVPFKIDKTPPTLVPDPVPDPNAQGWHKAPLTVTFPGGDATSGIDSCTADHPYSGPDTTNTQVTGSCTDKAGNSSGPKIYTLKYDATAPALVPDPVPDPNAQGWHRAPVTVKFPGVDATSGIASCTPDQSYGGPDTGNIPVPGFCSDKAGNQTNSAYTLKYDATAPALTPAPARGPDANGWYNHALSVSFPGSDATSGIDACTPPQSYSGPDSGNASVSGTCSDKAGNTTGKTFGFKYDATAPALVPDPVPDPNANGWHKAALTVKFLGVDATSGIAACTPDHPYNGPDTTNMPITGSCTDQAGNPTGPKTYTLKYDGTAPALTPAPSRGPDANGWYNHALSVSFPGTDTTSGIATCTPEQNYSGPDDAEASITGSCSDRAGNTTGKTFGFSYDDTAPTLAPDPVPDPNAQGWHKAPLTVKFPGADATSGIASCTPDHPYSGPDTTNTPITGSCTDRAGNPSGAKTYTLKYDATAPALVPDPVPDPNALGWHKAPLTVKFPGADAMSGIASCTADQPYGGPDTTGIQVTGSCSDQAGNTTGPKSYTLKYDATAPTLVPDPEPNPNTQGWHKAPLTVSFPGTDAISGIAACTPAQSYSGPDTGNTPIPGSCTDKAGNQTNTAYTLKYDATAPTLVPDPVPDPNAQGWHKAPLTVRFPGTDSTSGIASCTPDQFYGGPDIGNMPIPGSCTDKAGNQANTAYTLKYDATAPALTPAPSRAPDANGWYNQALSVSFPGVDATSQIATCTPQQPYSGPDNAEASISGSCTDNAGNTTPKTFGFKYDATAPALVPDPAPDPNANGWHKAALTVKFPGSDAMSGIAACTPDHPYGGPDTTNTPVTGSCTDQAGNSTGPKIYTLKYDATAPTLVPDPVPNPNALGWHKAPLTIKFPGADTTSGIASCTADHPYSGPDTTNTQITGSCTDQAGNPSGLKTYTLKYDATSPQVDGISPPPKPTGWYTEPIVFGFQGSDATSGPPTCPDVTYDGPDGADAFVTGVCLDKAGNVGTKPFPLKYDDTGPQVTPSASRGPDANGWYNSRLSVSFAGSDGASGLASCAPPQSYDGPDSVFAVVTGTCTDNAGNVGLGSLALKYDSTAPQVMGASPDRAPDGNGWYNHALTVSFLGSDATSQIEACTAAGYAGPDNPSASVSGICRDRAGNPSGASPFAFKYDATPPSLISLTVKAGNRNAVLTWNASSDTSLVEIVRTAGARGLGVTVYRGPGRSFTDTRLQNGVRYRYMLKGYDEARNVATKEAAATPTAPLISPRAGATVSAPPRLVWKAVEKATYYNVQVWRRGKIFSAWPTGTSLQLKRTWKYAGRSYRLSPGRYNWYVWPGYRSRARKDFGPLLGSSSFVVKAPRR